MGTLKPRSFLVRPFGVPSNSFSEGQRAQVSTRNTMRDTSTRPLRFLLPPSREQPTPYSV